MQRKHKIKFLIKIIIFALIVYFPIFMHLENIPIRIFDEARLAINAYEMNKTGNYIVTTFEGNPDMWNTKPPLMIWLQVIFIKILGTRELAIRLPAALAALFTCITILYFTTKHFNSYLYGLFAVVILITSKGYIDVHAVRTGDYDSLLILFTSLSSILFFVFIELYSGKNNKYLYFITLSLVCAVLTKGVHGLLFLPALIIYSIIKKKLFALLKNKHFYINLFIFSFIVIGYYILREHYNPGYIKAVAKNELGGRYLNTIEGHKHEFWYYFKFLKDYQYKNWIILLPLGVLSGFMNKDKRIKSLTLFLILLIIEYFLVISFAQTKLSWYALPLIPFLALITALITFTIFDLCRNKSAKLKIIMPLLIIGIAVVKPYIEIINKMFKPKEHPWDVEFYNIGYYLKNAIKSNESLNGYSLIHTDYYAHNLFYINILNDKGQDIRLINNLNEIDENSKIIIHQQKVKEYINENFTYDVLKNEDNILFLKLKSKK